MNTTSTIDRLVDDYLARLENAAADLPPDRRAELLVEIREHIAAARAAGAAADEAAVRTLLDRLGEPEEIVAAAREDTEPSGSDPASPPRHATAPARAGLRLGITAAILLTVGSFVFLVSWGASASILVGVIVLGSVLAAGYLALARSRRP